MEETKELKMNIQLFADGEQPSDGNIEPQGQSAPQNPTVDETGGNQPSGDSNFDWSIDPDTGDVKFDPAMFDDIDGGEPQDSNNSQELEDQPQQPPQPQTFTVKVDGVDRQVTLEELQRGYMMQADYTKKTQALADERRALEQRYNQQQNPHQGQPAPQQKPAQPQVDPKAYYKSLSDYAINQVQRNLGEDFDEYNPVHQAALADEISTIKAQMYERNVKQQQLQQVYNKYAQDPNIKEIDTYAAQRLNQLPYGAAVKIQQALRNNDARVIDAYMAAVRDEYYRNRGYTPTNERPVPQNQPMATPAKPVPNVKPPFAEPTGATKEPARPTQKNLDYTKLGKMNLDQQAQLAAKLGLG